MPNESRHIRPNRPIMPLMKSTCFYILVFGILMIILTPVFYLVSISFMSDFEAYNEWPLPLFPAPAKEFVLTRTEKGYLLSITRSSDKEREPLIETTSLMEMARFATRKTNCGVTAQRLIEKAEPLNMHQSTTFICARDWLFNYKLFFNVTQDAVSAIWRSIFVAFLTISISLIVGTGAGYAFARYKFRGDTALKVGTLFARMYPGVSVAIPMVIILGQIGLYDNPWGLSLVYAVGQISLTVWITASIFIGIPPELEEAAQVFGTSRIGAFFHITLPLAVPGFAACAMYAFIASWNETIQAMVLTQFNPTFPVVVYQSLVGAKGMINLTAAGGVVMTLPAILFTFFIRKYMLRMWSGVSLQ